MKAFFVKDWYLIYPFFVFFVFCSSSKIDKKISKNRWLKLISALINVYCLSLAFLLLILDIFFFRTILYIDKKLMFKLFIHWHDDPRHKWSIIVQTMIVLTTAFGMVLVGRIINFYCNQVYMLSFKLLRYHTILFLTIVDLVLSFLLALLFNGVWNIAERADKTSRTSWTSRTSCTAEQFLLIVIVLIIIITWIGWDEATRGDKRWAIITKFWTSRVLSFNKHWRRFEIIFILRFHLLLLLCFFMILSFPLNFFNIFNNLFGIE